MPQDPNRRQDPSDACASIVRRSCKDRPLSGNSPRLEQRQQQEQRHADSQQNVLELSYRISTPSQETRTARTSAIVRLSLSRTRQVFPQSAVRLPSVRNRARRAKSVKTPDTSSMRSCIHFAVVEHDSDQAEDQGHRRTEQDETILQKSQADCLSSVQEDQQRYGHAQHRKDLRGSLSVVHRGSFGQFALLHTSTHSTHSIRRRNPPAMIRHEHGQPFAPVVLRFPVRPETPASEKRTMIRSPPRARTGLCQVGAGSGQVRQGSHCRPGAVATAILPNLKANLLPDSRTATSRGAYSPPGG